MHKLLHTTMLPHWWERIARIPNTNNILDISDTIKFLVYQT